MNSFSQNTFSLLNIIVLSIIIQSFIRSFLIRAWTRGLLHGLSPNVILPLKCCGLSQNTMGITAWVAVKSPLAKYELYHSAL